jgi:hypothetical protein
MTIAKDRARTTTDLESKDMEIILPNMSMCGHIEAWVMGHDQDTQMKHAVFRLAAAWHKDSGVVELGIVSNIITAKKSAELLLTEATLVAMAGGDIGVRVTGVVGETIKWRAVIRVTII